MKTTYKKNRIINALLFHSFIAIFFSFQTLYCMEESSSKEPNFSANLITIKDDSSFSSQSKPLLLSRKTNTETATSRNDISKKAPRKIDVKELIQGFSTLPYEIKMHIDKFAQEFRILNVLQNYRANPQNKLVINGLFQEVIHSKTNPESLFSDLKTLHHCSQSNLIDETRFQNFINSYINNTHAYYKHHLQNPEYYELRGSFLGVIAQSLTSRINEKYIAWFECPNSREAYLCKDYALSLLVAIEKLKKAQEELINLSVKHELNY